MRRCSSPTPSSTHWPSSASSETSSSFSSTSSDSPTSSKPRSHGRTPAPPLPPPPSPGPPPCRRYLSGTSSPSPSSGNPERTPAPAPSVCSSSPRRMRFGVCGTANTFSTAPAWTVGSITIKKRALYVGLPLCPMTCLMIIINASGLLLGSTSSTPITLLPSDSQFLRTFFSLSIINHESELYITKPKNKRKFLTIIHFLLTIMMIIIISGVIGISSTTMVAARVSLNIISVPCYYFNYTIIDLWSFIEYFFFFFENYIDSR